MYKNIGAKIKVLAKIIAIALAVGSFSYGLFIAIKGYTEWIGFLLMVLGPILSWISMFFIYGYGELIEKTSETNNTINDIAWQLTKDREKQEAKSEAQKSVGCGVPLFLQVQQPDSSKTPPELLCPSCGAKVQRAQKFCSGCGQPFTWK